MNTSDQRRATRPPRFHASTLPRIYVLTLLLSAAVLGRPVYLLAEDACPLQWNFRAYVPYTLDANEPNSPNSEGYKDAPILCPIRSDDPNLDPADDDSWLAPVGKLVRTASCCVPAGWVVSEIRTLDGTSQASVTYDSAQAEWTLATDVHQAVNWWAIRAESRCVRDMTIWQARTVFVTCLGLPPDEDGRPVLAWIRQWLEAA